MIDHAVQIVTGKGPHPDQYLQLKTGLQLFDHPTTPFEDAVARCAASACASVSEVTRGLRQTLRALGCDCCHPDTHFRCLHWIETRSLGA